MKKIEAWLAQENKKKTMMSLILEILDAMEEEIHVEMPTWHDSAI